MPLLPTARERQQSRAASSKADAKILLNAVALQDHFARMLQIPGAKLKPASLKPGSSPTLAQRHGLVKAPLPLLSEQQWLSTHAKSAARQDSQHECSICCEHFGMEEQVLLSCSHVFHKQCITSFERFARSRCCPLCRTEAYQKRRVHDGQEAHKHRCSVRVQAAVRGYLARKWYRHLRRRLPPQNPCLTRKWAVEQLQDNTGRLLKHMAAARDDLDTLFAELDTSLAESKQIFNQISGDTATSAIDAVHDSVAALSATHIRSTESAAPQPSISQLQVPAYIHVGDPLVVDECTLPDSSANIQHVDWDHVISSALQRGSTECAICLGALERHGSQGVAWLSCTHVYHVDCISAFEAFELSRSSQPSCPCCRAKYVWKTL